MKDIFIHEKAEVEDGAMIGVGTKIWHFAHIRGTANIGANCNIGHCAYIGDSVKIGNNCKIGNKASIFKGVRIHDDVFIAPHVCFTNDKYPRSIDEWELKKTIVEKGASIGANSTIICGIKIGEGSMVGAGSVVTKDVPPNTLVYGNPARHISHLLDKTYIK